MKNQSLKPIFLIIIALAGFGLIYTIVKQPFELIQRIFFILLFIGVFYGIYKIYAHKLGGKENSAYMKAAKHSKKRLNGNNHKKGSSKGGKKLTPLTKQRVNLEKKKNELHLTVIEGKKGKKKNRASF